MLNKIVFNCLLYLCVFNAKVYATGPLCFGYEVFAHPPIDEQANTNNVLSHQALRGYGVNNIIATHFMQPGAPLIYILSRAGNGLPWQSANIPINIPQVPPFQQASEVAQQRSLLGIRVDAGFLGQVNAFLNQVNAAINAGNIAPNAPSNLIQSLKNGGYHPMASVLFQLTTMEHTLNFFREGDHNQVVIHIKIPSRVGKNMKELSYNLRTSSTPAYQTLKNHINTQAAEQDIQNPSSITVVTFPKLQQS